MVQFEGTHRWELRAGDERNALPGGWKGWVSAAMGESEPEPEEEWSARWCREEREEWRERDSGWVSTVVALAWISACRTGVGFRLECLLKLLTSETTASMSTVLPRQPLSAQHIPSPQYWY